MANMNPNFPNTRGCFIDAVSNPEKVTVVDYPTWQVKNGNYVTGQENQPISDGQAWQKDFKTKEEAYAFAKSENYVACQLPRILDPKHKNDKPEVFDPMDEEI